MLSFHSCKKCGLFWLGNLKEKHCLEGVCICERAVLQKISNNKMRRHGQDSGKGQAVGCREAVGSIQCVEFLLD